jgi:hypothetical protein
MGHSSYHGCLGERSRSLTEAASDRFRGLTLTPRRPEAMLRPEQFQLRQRRATATAIL